MVKLYINEKSNLKIQESGDLWGEGKGRELRKGAQKFSIKFNQARWLASGCSFSFSSSKCVCISCILIFQLWKGFKIMKPEEWGEMNIKNAKGEGLESSPLKQPSAVSISCGMGCCFWRLSLRPSDEVEGGGYGLRGHSKHRQWKRTSPYVSETQGAWWGGARWGCRAWKMRQVPGPIWSLARALESWAERHVAGLEFPLADGLRCPISCRWQGWASLEVKHK